MYTDWQDSDTPHFLGHALKLLPYERSWSLATGLRGFVLGTEWQVYAYDRDGTERWRQPLPSVAWAVNVSGDGRYVIVAAGDGTLRWYADRGDRAEEVLALYVHPDGQRWIAWTPQGFFDASGPDAEQLFGFQINHGREQAGEFVRASQLRERFLNPELIAHRLDADGDQRLQATLAKLGDIDAALRESPPSLRLGGDVRIDAANGSVHIPLRVEGRTDGSAALRYRVDGGAELQPRETDASGGAGFVRLDLAPGPHTVTITQAGPQGTRSPTLVVPVTMPGHTRPPALHVLAIGISNYRDVDLRRGVRFASSDAATIASRLAARARPLFREVYSRPLLDTDADRNGIEAGLQELAGSVQPQDVLVIYFAGHGTADEADYYFVPQEAVQRNRADLLKASLSGSRLRELLAAIPASKKLVLLDTCASGKFQQPDRSIDTKNAAEALARKSGFALIAAAGGDRYALEATSHGVFTSALLEALDGKAAVGDDDTLSIDAIADYVSRRVPELTNLHFKVEQFPVRQFNGNSFPVAVVRNGR